MGQMAGQGTQIAVGGDQRVKAKDLGGTDGNATKLWPSRKEARNLLGPFFRLKRAHGKDEQARGRGQVSRCVQQFASECGAKGHVRSTLDPG